jgi:hypothetical protein
MNLNSLIGSIFFQKLGLPSYLLKIYALIRSSLYSILRASIQCCSSILGWEIGRLSVLRMWLKLLLFFLILLFYLFNVILIVIYFEFTLTKLFFEFIYLIDSLLILKGVRNRFFLLWWSIIIVMNLFFIYQILRALFQVYNIFIVCILIDVLRQFPILWPSYLNI